MQSNQRNSICLEIKHQRKIELENMNLITAHARHRNKQEVLGNINTNDKTSLIGKK